MKNKINESKVIVENSKNKTIFSEEIQNNGGWMSVDEMFDLLEQDFTQSDELLYKV